MAALPKRIIKVSNSDSALGSARPRLGSVMRLRESQLSLAASFSRAFSLGERRRVGVLIRAVLFCFVGDAAAGG